MLTQRTTILAVFAASVAVLAPAMNHASAQEEFLGHIGKTMKDSKPYFPPPLMPKAGSPNIVYIVLDDTGFSDLGCYGSEIATPNIDRLAASGLRFNNFHTRAICSPTRAALLTGRNSHAVGMANLSNVVNGFPNHRGNITHEATTVAELLQSTGYNTFAVGKWHLTSREDPSGPLDQWPQQRGFDRYYGFIGGMTDQYYPELIDGNTTVTTPRPPNYHLEVDLVDHAIQDVRDATAGNPDRPFFLYLAMGATHAPHQAPKAFVDKYVPVFQKGWDQTRKERLTREKQMGIVPQNTDLAARNPGVLPWDKLGPDERKVYTRLEAAFAGYLEHADLQIGRLIAYIDQLGRLDNTLVVLMSDNGASQEGDFDGTLNEVYNVVNLAHAEQPTEEQVKHLDDIGTYKSYNNYPKGWAMAGNTPFPYYKQTVWGGGERDPLIFFWPNGIKDKGRIRNQFVDVIDITPTILDIAGITVPKEYHGVPQMPLQGASIASVLQKSDAPAPRNTQYFELWGQRAMEQDGWKAVATHVPGTDFDRDTWALYDLHKDFSEAHDVAETNPEKLHSLQDLWWSEAAKYDVLPIGDQSALQVVGERNRAIAKSVYTFYPGQSHLLRDQVPAIGNRSFTITATVDRPNADTEGVLVVNGDRFSGYVLYIMNHRLVFDFSDFGKHTVVTSTDDVPVGHSTLKYEFVRSADFKGKGTLSINGKNVGEAPFSLTPAGLVGFTGLDIGHDIMSPVSDAYADKGEFAFPQGALEKVVIEVRPLGT